MQNKFILAVVVTLFVSACGGGGDGESAAAPVANLAPIAAISVNSTSGSAPLTVAFDGSASLDSDGSIGSYAWSSGDGGSYTGSTASHTYNTPGTYSATLTVTDNDGASTSVAISIDVQNPTVNVPPVAAITVAKTTGYAPLVLAFDGSSSNDSDGSIASYTWTTGDGASYTGSTADHTYTTLGSFVATLTVTDDQGDSSSTTVTVDVHAQAAGYYWGLESVDGTGRLLYVERQVASDHRVFEDVYDGLTDMLVGLASGTLDVAGTATTGTLLMQSDADVYLDGLELGSVDFTGAIDTTMSGDITPRITGDFVGRGDSGLYELYYDEQLNSAKSLADLEGVWSWTDGAGFTETMVIQADGSFVDTYPPGCTLVGKFTPMDPGLNEFDIEYDLTCVPVSGAGDGHRKGVAVINDVWYTDIWLDWNVIYQEGPRAGLRGGGSVMRTRPVAGTGTGAQKQRERRSHPDQGVR